jgi:two-component system, cell cycle response regulator
MNGRILVVDDLATNRIVYRARLAAAFYEPILAADGKSCLSMAQDERPDLILLDLNLPDIIGNEVLQRLRCAPETRDTPVIVLTAATDAEARLAALSAGADDVMTKPTSEAILLARVRNLLRTKADASYPETAVQLAQHGFAEPTAIFEPSATIALVDSSAAPRYKWWDGLRGQIRDKLVNMTRSQALADAGMAEGGRAQVPDVFIIQDDGSAVGGLRLLSELKSHAATRHSAVCFVGLSDDGDGAAMAFDLGADDVVGADVSAAELALRMRSLLRRKRQGDRQRASLQDGLRMAMIDPLTGLHNRRYAMPKLAGIAAQADVEGESFSVMVVDLDKFKLVNDHYGHAAGDQVLIEVAMRLTSNLRMSDLLARIGGEEFLVALPRTPKSEARLVARRLCEAVEELPILLPSGQSLKVTVSIGVAVSSLATSQAQQVANLVEEADLAMLEAKNSGRNKVTFRRTAA